MTVASTVVLLKEAVAASRTGNKPLTRQLFRQVTELDPGHEMAWLWLAGVAETPVETVQCLERVLEINPENARAREGLGAGRLQAGIVEARSGNKRGATIFFQQVVAAEPNHEEAWLWLASVADAPEEAISALERVLELNPDNARACEGLQTAFFQAGILEAKNGNKQMARGWLQRLTDLDPSHEHGWLWLANVAETPEYALSCLQRVLELNPNNTHAQAGVAWHKTLLAPALKSWTCPLCGTTANGEPERCPACHALQSLENPQALLETHPVERAQCEAAIAHYQNFLAIQPDATVHFYIALAFANLQQFEPAVQHLQAAVRLDANDTRLRTQLAVLTGLSRAFEATRNQAQIEAVRRTVLIVDDSPTVRKLVTVTMEKAGYRVVTAADGQSAVDLIRDKGVPNLIFLDLGMPGLDGYQVCKIIKQTTHTQHVPVIILSSKDGFFDKVRGRMAGASDFITKPFRPETLEQTAAKYCPRS